MSTNSDIEPDRCWPKGNEIDRDELIELIHSWYPDESRKQIRSQIEYHQKGRNGRPAKHPLPPGRSFPNNIAAYWIRQVRPRVVRSRNFPKAWATGYVDDSFSTVIFPPSDELHLAFKQCLIENLQLKEYVQDLEEKLSKRGRPKKT